MPASYPGAVKNYTSKTDGVDDVLASHVNDLQLEVTAIETELGTDPAGTYTDLKTRLATFPAPDGWTDPGETWTYASASTFTVAGDVTGKYGKGDKLKFTQTTVKYAVISATPTYSAPNTTITIAVNTDYTIAAAAISANYYSKAENPQGFPDWFNYVPTLTGWSVNPATVARFMVSARKVTVSIYQGLVSTSNATNIVITGPITAATVAGMIWGAGIWSVQDNGAYPTSPGRAIISSASANITCGKDTAGGAWTNSGAKSVGFTLIYEI